MKHASTTMYFAASITAALCTLVPLAADGPKPDDKKQAATAPATATDEYRVGPGDKLRRCDARRELVLRPAIFVEQLLMSGERELACARVVFAYPRKQKFQVLILHLLRRVLVRFPRAAAAVCETRFDAGLEE